jgi:uncharacterized membrane protein
MTSPLLPVAASRGKTEILGIVIPSTDPLLLALVGCHVFVALIAVVAGAGAMLASKGSSRHPKLGTLYYWSLAATVAFALALSVMRWSESYPLAILGVLALTSATIARTARRDKWQSWMPVHVWGMGASYILMLTAFYVDNAENLPIWRELPRATYWTLPALVGVPVIVWALKRHLRTLG